MRWVDGLPGAEVCGEDERPKWSHDRPNRRPRSCCTTATAPESTETVTLANGLTIKNAAGTVLLNAGAAPMASPLLLRPLGNVAYCLPPYCITDEELDLVYGVIHRFLGGARAEGLTTGGPVDD